MKAPVTLEAVHTGYRGKRVLAGIDLQLEPNESLALIGANGAGKTTLMHSILDFAEIDQGAIRLFGINHRQTAARQRLAYLPERFTPPYYLSGERFIRYYLELQQLTVAPAAIQASCRALDLPETALQQSVGHLSKGMSQKLGLMAVLLSGKPLLLLDEPMSGLDPRARALFTQQLQQAREQGQSLLLTTHLLADAERLCDRLAILDRGRICFCGSPAEFLRRYQADDIESAYLRCTASSDSAGLEP